MGAAMTTTPIEWARGDGGETWNPVAGYSPGCINCYATAIAAGLAQNGATRAEREGTMRLVNGNLVRTGHLMRARGSRDGPKKQSRHGGANADLHKSAFTRVATRLRLAQREARGRPS
jgi:protein gp37